MTPKGFKITDSERKTRVGIAVKNYDDLKKKTIDKFKLKYSPNQINFQTPDGTVIENDEYFQTLPAQTLLIWVKDGERADTDAEILYRTIREVNDEYLSAGEKVQEFFTEKMKNKVFKLAEVLRGIDGDKSKLSSKTEHPEWFEGLDTLAKTKEEYMFRRAQDRIRTYYYKTKEELSKSKVNNTIPSHELERLLREMQTRLKLSKYQGHLFDRRRATGGDAHLRSLCDAAGRFECQGRWDKLVCLYLPVHSINPYRSREERIVFQTWNLDHTKERSRAVIPAVRATLQEEGGVIKGRDDSSVDYKAIFNDLFTTNNLKFVHIVCHDKGAHTTKIAGPYLLN
ncbi:unnamed protein product [Brassicogethes aeneus]|uniref:CIDE-N domain-containing protein n=1 Tax=Brassicogethes aeneus TaxID=1431903 RepID=A0A9P0FNI1_BRAAE|nr:unnamed protein product [Brassicogethes aeneus]